MDIIFEPLNESHFPLLLKWLETPHVKKWWDQDIIYTLDLVKEKYGNDNYTHQEAISTEISKKVYAYIVLINNEKIGYIQAYNAKGYVDDTHLNLESFKEPVCGIDLFIGEETKLHSGLGAIIINAFIDQLLRFHYSWCLIDPAHNNTIAIKAFERAGFEAAEQLKTDKHHWMLKKILDIPKHIEELELLLLDPKVRKSAEQLNKLLADDFYEIGASGKIYNKQDILTALPLQEDTFFEVISDFTVCKMAENLWRINYVLKEVDRYTKRTSMWRNNNNQYQMVFHQGTIIIQEEQL